MKRWCATRESCSRTKDLLKDDVYVYHTKANTKQALDGAIYEWHQDYINWKMMDAAEPAC